MRIAFIVSARFTAGRIIVHPRNKGRVGVGEGRHDQQVDHLSVLIHFFFRGIASCRKSRFGPRAIAQRIAHHDFFSHPLFGIARLRTHIERTHIVLKVRIRYELLEIGRIGGRERVVADQHRIESISGFRPPIRIVALKLCRYRVVLNNLLQINQTRTAKRRI